MVVVVVVSVVEVVDSVVSAGASFTVVVVDSVDEGAADEGVDEGTVVPLDALTDVPTDVLPVALTDGRLLPLDIVLVCSRDGRVVLPSLTVVSSQSSVPVVVVPVELVVVITTPPE